jgi:AmiR/NasT family two-component response regulator
VTLADLARFPTASVAPIGVCNTAEAIRLIESEHPHLVAIDWDNEDFDGQQISSAAGQRLRTGILAVLAAAKNAPSALRAGCHAVLLRPLTTNLIAARLGRLSRELPSSPATFRARAEAPAIRNEPHLA